MAKNNIIVKLQRWMDSKAGQMFLNYAYSWGASIVILGALFKITHIDGADFMLFLGMGTEVIVFFLAGFERPYDVDNKKEGTANTELAGGEPATIGGGGGTFIVGGGIPGATGGSGESVIVEGGESGEAAAISGSGVSGGGSGVSGGGTIIIGGGGGGSGVPGGGTIIIGGGGGGSGVPSSGSGQPVGAPVVAPIAASGENAQPTENAQSIDPAQLAGAIAASPIVASPQFTGMCPEMQEATQTYVDQLNELTDILKKVAEQSARLTRDSEEMENMNRTLTGINRFYEMQLRSVSAQSASVDEVNEQTKRLASQLEELNQVYARMVEALKVNMTVKGD